jgi:hypothetical protein
MNDDNPPFLQRLLERPFLLLALGMGVMLLFYTGWGLVELALLPQAALP